MIYFCEDRSTSRVSTFRLYSSVHRSAISSRGAVAKAQMGRRTTSAKEETPELQKRPRMRNVWKIVYASAAGRRWCDPNAVLHVTKRTNLTYRLLARSISCRYSAQQIISPLPSFPPVMLSISLHFLETSPSSRSDTVFSLPLHA